MSSRPTIDERSAVRSAIRGNAQTTVPYLAMNMLASALAAYGLLANSTAVVIGAMIVALMLGPIIGLALGVTDNDHRLIQDAAATLLIGASAVFVTAAVIGFIHRDLPLTNEILVRTSPNILDLLIAFAGGAAGAYATVSPRLSVALVGVAVATALVPPLAASALLIARADYQLGWHALLLAITNIVAIQFASSIVLLLTGYREHETRSGNRWGWLERNVATLVVLVVLGVALAFNLRNVLAEQLFESRVRDTIVRDLRSSHPFAHVDDVRFDVDSSSGHLVVRAVVRTVDTISPPEVAEIEDQLPNTPSGRQRELRIREVHVDVITRSGPITEIGPPSQP
ncbi:MAG: DUF389 domain-containing protein [Ilumatobacteraceae bacterium]